jgi:type IV pilus assembly protein PilY1
LSQCIVLDAAQKALANDGQKMTNFIRGQQEMEVAGIYRNREHVLGDIASAKPAYVRNPRRNYGDSGYGAYKLAQATRQAMVYVGANDGMLHALNATTGQESWAYVPRMVLPNLYKLASENYGSAHQFYVDGSPESGDVYIGGSWRTILVGGLNNGGRGYYALDITNPTAPTALWEFCSDSSLCTNTDSDLGYTYGNPVITKRPSDGKWVVLVTSGYNNVSPGDGKGYLYVLDAATGTVLNKISTGVGSTTTPSGLARITARAENAATDNTGTEVFGGDVLGNLWRFNMTANTAVNLASLTDHLGTAQPITSSPEVGKCDSTNMVFVGTGKYLGVSDLTDTQRQTMYGIKDSTTSLGVVRTNNMVQQSFSPVAGGYTATGNAVDLTAKNGWFADLDQNTGERVNLDPSLVLGTLVFVTNQPTEITACSTGGISYLYQLDYCTGSYLAAASNQIAGQKLFNSIAVGFIVIRLPGGGFKGIFTPAGGGQVTSDITAGGKGKARRVSWREFVK